MRPTSRSTWWGDSRVHPRGLNDVSAPYKRSGGERKHQRRADPAWRHHQNGQRAPPARRRRSGVGVSAPSEHRPVSATRQKNLALSDEVRRSPGRRNSGCTNATSHCGARQKQTTSRDRTGTGTLGFIWAIGVQTETTAEATSQNRLAGEGPHALLDSRADDSAGPTKRRTLLTFYAERFPNPTRALSPRQLPTDHDHAVPTREYQSDQSSRSRLGRHRCCAWYQP